MHQGTTVPDGVKPVIHSIVDTLNQILPRLSPADQSIVQGVIESIGMLDDLLTCIRRHGDKHPRFVQLYEEWRVDFRERRRQAGFSGVKQLEERSGIPGTTLHLMETGHRPPTRDTMEALLGVAELGLDRQDLFVQVVLNR